MTNHMLIDAQDPDETRVVVTDDRNNITHFDFVTKAKSQIKGNIFLAKITRVEPSLQAAFVEYGAEKQGFLPFSEIHPDYYQIPVEDRKKLLEEVETQEAEEDVAEEAPKKPARRRGRRKKTETTSDADDSAEDTDNSEDAAETESTNQKSASKKEAGASDEESDNADSDDEASVDTAEEDAEKKAPRRRGRRKTFTKTQAAKRDVKEDVVVSEDASEEDGAPINPDEDEVDEVRKKRPTLNRRYKIQEVIKPGQIILVQVIKEERGNKGVSLSSYISLAGRYCVLMPNSPKDGGISRKISTSDDRKRLKEISDELKALRGMSAIIRTAGTGRTRAEIKRDYEYLIKLWNQIREDALASMAPAVVYEENDIIKRSIRDHYDGNIERIFVQGEASYKQAKAFMKLLMPSHAPRVKQYKEPEPLFVAHNIERTIDSLYNPRAELPSGGYIIINPTEALISIDVNSGSSTNERNVEETAYKTNLEAAREVARQLRLRNLGGLIVVDFIDMNYGKHRKNVEREVRNAMKDDRARTQVGHISSFGLMELSRQRMGASLEETTTQECVHCAGTGKVLHADAIVIQLMRNLQAFVRDHAAPKITLQLPKAVAQSFFNQYRTMLAEIEAANEIAFELEIIVDEDAGVYAFDNHNGATFHSAHGLRFKNNNNNNNNRRNKSKRSNNNNNQHNNRQQQAKHSNNKPQQAKEENSDTQAENKNTNDADAETANASQEDKPKRKPRRSRGRRSNANNDNKQTSDTASPADTSKEEKAVSDDTDTVSEKKDVAESDKNTSEQKPRRGRRPKKDIDVSKTANNNEQNNAAAQPKQQEPQQEAKKEEQPAPKVQKPAEPKMEDTPTPKRKRKGWWQRVVEG